jgi:hypothetical protein
MCDKSGVVSERTAWLGAAVSLRSYAPDALAARSTEDVVVPIGRIAKRMLQVIDHGGQLRRERDIIAIGDRDWCDVRIDADIDHLERMERLVAGRERIYLDRR